MDCAVCKKEDGFFEEHRQMINRPGYEKYVLCQDCYDKAVRIKDGKHSAADVEHFNTHFSSGTVEQPVVNILQSIIKGTATKPEPKQEIMVSSGYSFDGYQIAAYMDFIEYQTAMGMGHFKTWDTSLAMLTGSEATDFQEKISKANQAVILGLKKRASAVGANAIIGLTLRHAMFAANLVGIVATGTAVKIEKA
jgi:Uncharacterized conserved protein